MGSSSRRKKLIGAAAIAGLTLWVLIPLAAASILYVGVSTSRLEPLSRAFVQPTTNTDGLTRPVSLDLMWEISETPLAPQWSGTVQQVLVSPAAPVSPGDSVARIDGIVRLAASTPMPFWRPLSVGDSGADVAMLNDYLRSRALSAPVSTDFTYESLQALREFAKSIDVPDATQVTSFDPGWVVFLPAPLQIGEVKLQVGAPAPAPGAEIVTSLPRLKAAVLAPRRSEATPLTEAPQVATGAVTPSEYPSDGENLAVFSTQFGLSADNPGWVVDSDLERLSTLVQSGVGNIAAVLEMPSANDQWVVPATVLLTGPNDSYCVLRKNGDRVDEVAVQLVAVVRGKAAITGPLRRNDNLQILPASEAAGCT